MRTIWFVVFGALASLSAPMANGDPAPLLQQWPQWRGPTGNGVAPAGDPPIEWSETSNVRWKTTIPGKGHSTPIVWGDHVFLTTAEAHGEALAAGAAHDHADGAHDNMQPRYLTRFTVLAIDRHDGSIAWTRTVRDEVPHEATHETGSWASASPVTDGKHIYVSFGSKGIYCLDMDGAVVWETDLGEMQSRHEHGEGSSPTLHGDTLVVNWDHQGDSYLFALDAETGKTRWKVARDEITSWSTPLIVEVDGNPQVVVSATGRVRGYDLRTGKEIWRCGGLSRNVVSSPVASDGYLYVSNSYDWQAMLAIRLSDAKGDISDSSAIVWRLDRDTPYVPSPLLDGDSLCFLKHNQGFLTCLEAQSGKARFGPVRIRGLHNVFASPVGAAGRIYIAGRNGATAVVKNATSFELLSLNTLDDGFSASPAVAGDELFLRGEQSLYCIAEDRTSE